MAPGFSLRPSLIELQTATTREYRLAWEDERDGLGGRIYGQVIDGSGAMIGGNVELTALGLSNLTSSVSQGYAVSGSLARSALNAAAGARTQLAAIVSALCVGITTLFFTPLFHYLPSATLAQQVASGFNRMHRHNEEGGSDPDEF